MALAGGTSRRYKSYGDGLSGETGMMKIHWAYFICMIAARVGFFAQAFGSDEAHLYEMPEQLEESLAFLPPNPVTANGMPPDGLGGPTTVLARSWILEHSDFLQKFGESASAESMTWIRKASAHEYNAFLGKIYIGAGLLNTRGRLAWHDGRSNDALADMERLLNLAKLFKSPDGKAIPSSGYLHARTFINYMLESLESFANTRENADRVSEFVLRFPWSYPDADIVLDIVSEYTAAWASELKSKASLDDELEGIANLKIPDWAVPENFDSARVKEAAIERMRQILVLYREMTRPPIDLDALSEWAERLKSEARGESPEFELRLAGLIAVEAFPFMGWLLRAEHEMGKRWMALGGELLPRDIPTILTP